MALAFDDSRLRAADTLFVAFTGVQQALGGIPFEFHRSLAKTACAALFIRDPDKTWYQCDEAGVAEVVRVVQDAMARTGATRLVTLGNSMGGFGALLFGKLCDADEIIAMAAQTAIGPEAIDDIGDPRWAEFQKRIPAYTFPDLALLEPPRAAITMVWGTEDPWDGVHVERLAAVWPMDIMAVDGAEHDVAAVLRDRGLLMPLLERASEARRPPKRSLKGVFGWLSRDRRRKESEARVVPLGPHTL